MGGHEHGHHDPYKVPKASIYKVSDVPQLAEVEKALARQNLRDPWLRNEVWRYDVKSFGTHRTRAIKFFFRGFPLGVAAFAATILAEQALGVDWHGGHHADHGDSGHGAGHH